MCFCVLDQAVPVALGRGRKPAQTNRSRQQLQREKALQVASRHNVGTSLPEEQKLTKPRPEAAPQRPDGRLIEEQLKNGKPPDPLPVKADVAEPSVKELEKQEVELLVFYLFIYFVIYLRRSLLTELMRVTGSHVKVKALLDF